MSRYVLADIGGTHTRVAVARPGGTPSAPVRYRNAELAGPLEAITRAANDCDNGCGEPLVVAAAVAGPVAGGRVRLTNLGWTLDAAELAQRCGAQQAVVINDYQALARALPELPAAATAELCAGSASADGALAVLGPGTGLGVAAAVPHGGQWSVVVGEGGHVTLAASDDDEAAVLAALRAELGHVSAEAVLCGVGLARLHRHLHGVESPPEAITAAADTDRQAQRSLDLFCRFLGTTAGNLALTVGARGGLFLAGGLLAALGPQRLAASPFYERFVAKGRFRPYLEAVPVRLIGDPEAAALLGLRAWLDDLR